MAEARTFTDLVNWLLARLYEYDGPDDYPDLRKLVAELDSPVRLDELLDAAHLLDDNGLIEALFTGGMNVAARITGPGRLLLEEARADKSETTLGNVVTITGSGNVVAVGNMGDVRQTALNGKMLERIFVLLGDALAALETDESLAPDEREDAVADIMAVQTQLRRTRPNLGAVRAHLAPLERLVPVGALVVEILSLLQH